jgi:hypothetical protein
VKCHDTKCDVECDVEHDAKHDAKCARDLIGRNLETWIFAYEPCFLGRPRRGKTENSPSPSSLRNQASRRNDNIRILGYD